MEEILLSVHDACKKFGNKNVLQGINIELYKGDIYGLIGANGVGKTTFIKSITGLLNLDSGVIKMSDNIRIGIVLDQNGLYSQLSGKQNIELYIRMYGEYDERKVSNMFDLIELNNEKNDKVYKYSKGMKRRLVLGRTLLCDPNLLILDEPFDGLDISSQITMIRCLKDWVKQGDRCILYTSHNVNEIQMMCNKIGFIKKGKIEKEGYISDLITETFKDLRLVAADTCSEDITRYIIDLSDRIVVNKNEIKIFTEEDNIPLIMKRLKENNIEPVEFNKEYDDLLDIYLGVNNVKEKYC